jgi:hypothetical protein
MERTTLVYFADQWWRRIQPAWRTGTRPAITYTPTRRAA